SGIAEQAQMLQGTQLVGDDTAVIVVLVLLERVDTEDELCWHGVTERTLRAAREVPGLLPAATGSLGIADGKGPVQAARVQEGGVRLLVIPDVGVAAPVLVADL